jgi:hypothetical protein
LHELGTGADDRRAKLTQPQRTQSKTEWSDARIRRELEEFLRDASEWPSYRAFQRAGRQTLRDQVTHSGGPRLWAKRLGLIYPERKPGYVPRWTEERVRADLDQFLRSWERWPSRLEFEAAGQQALRDAVRRLGGSARWAAEFGLPLQNLKSGSNLVWTDERIEAELRGVLDGRDAWPTRRELARVGSFGLATAVAQRGGTAYWARRLGFEVPPRAGMGGRRRWTDERIRAELEEFCRDRTTWPTEREFFAAGKSKLYSAACHYGGTPRWAAQLGLVQTRGSGSSPRSRWTTSERALDVPP